MTLNPNPYTGPKGLFNITSTPLSILHQIANPQLLSQPLTTDQPRTKSDRCTKIFIGKIPPNITDYFMQQLYLQCGQVNSWQRMLDSSGKPLPWGFVQYLTVQGMLRCLRLMNGLWIQKSRIICRIDTQTQFFIKEWSDLKRADWQRKRMDNLGKEEMKSWQEEVLGQDSTVLYNIQLMIHNLEQNPDQAPVEVEIDQEHPRERERENRMKMRVKERERQFKDLEKEWTKREKQKQRERAKQREKQQEKEREKMKQMKRDFGYESNDQTRARKYSKKFSRSRQEKKKQREREKQEDKQNARKEFELMYPGVATTEQKIIQALEMEEMNPQLHQKQYRLKEHQDLQISIKPKQDRVVTSSDFFMADPEQNEQIPSLTHQPLQLDFPQQEQVPQKQQQPEITKQDFDKHLNSLKTLLEKVPVRRHQLYPYKLNWNMMAQNRIIDKKLTPFVGKLFVRYVGQDDQKLVQMIARMVANREDPYSIQSKVETFMEDDA